MKRRGKRAKNEREKQSGKGGKKKREIKGAALKVFTIPQDKLLEV